MSESRSSHSRRAPLRDAAVLVPVYRDTEGELRLVIVRRTERGIHGGQLAFPGGNREPEDPTPLDTALREAEEEIGLPRSSVSVLAPLDVLETSTTGYRIAPFLGGIIRPAEWRPDPDEVAEVLEPAVGEMVVGGPQQFDLQLPGWPSARRIDYYPVGPHRLWGISYRILSPLLPRLVAGEWAIG